MQLFPRFTNKRRVLQLGWYALRHGPGVFDKLNTTNLFLARQFDDREIQCNVCGETARIWYEMHSTRQKHEHKVGHLRETLECLNCLSRTRYRLMASALLAECRARFAIDSASIADLAGRIDHVDILDTDAFSPAVPLLRRSAGYKVSSYLPHLPPGLVSGESRVAGKAMYNVDLQAIPFPDRSCDVILSSDVMEHVRDFERANREILRVLKPGGAHLFTVPFHEPAATTRVLIDTSTGEDIYLEPPQVHGDDNLSAGVPAYRVYGLDLVDDLRALGFEARHVHVRDAAHGIFDESYFVARRPA